MSAKRTLSRYGPVALLISGAVLLFLAQSAYWVNHTVFNRKNFSDITTTALLSETSRDAIASAVVDQSLKDRPLIKRVIGERVESLISGLLDTDLSTQAVALLTNRTYAYATSSDRQDIKIDLAAIKSPLTAIVALAQNVRPDGRLASTELQIPDEIVLVRQSAFPDLSGVVKLMLWLGPLLWLGTLLCFGLYIYAGRQHYAKKVYTVGVVVMLVALFGLATNPFIPPPIAAAVPNIELRPVAESLASGFLKPFATQMQYMLGVTLVSLLLFSQRFNIVSGIRALESKMNRPAPKR